MLYIPTPQKTFFSFKEARYTLRSCISGKGANLPNMVVLYLLNFYWRDYSTICFSSVITRFINNTRFISNLKLHTYRHCIYLLWHALKNELVDPFSTGISRFSKFDNRWNLNHYHSFGLGMILVPWTHTTVGWDRSYHSNGVRRVE